MDRIEKLLGFLRESPQDSFLQHALALEYMKEGNFEGAVSLFREILDRDPGYIGSYYHLGKALENTGDAGEALQVYERGMEMSRKAKDNHALNELRNAYEELADI